MEMINLTLPATNPFATEYGKQASTVQNFFEYNYQEPNTYLTRWRDLQERTFHREALANVIEKFMASYPSSSMVEQSLTKLKSKDSVVVIGGQQAGLLSGPLYTIHKIISIITFAEQQEKQLGIPVIPIFWIAGEDHDYDEINHVFVEREQRLVKMVYPQKVNDKRMVSHINLQQEVAFQWVAEIVATYGETTYTNDLLQFSYEILQQSLTVVDFFANIIMEIFKDFGLLIVDSGDRAFRKLLSEHLMKQINLTQTFTEAILTQQEEIATLGYRRTLQIDHNAANLFFYENNDRNLLVYEDGIFTNKRKTITITKNQLLEIAKNQPEKLSTNVAARAVAQEYLFPTLAFIAGPGEIAYWAELTKTFQLFEMKMPPVVPRLNMTIVDRAIYSDLLELQLDLDDVLVNGTKASKEAYLATVTNATLIQFFEEMKLQLTEQYQEIAVNLQKLDKGLLPLLQKNKQMVHSQLDFMVQRINRAIEQKHACIIKKFDRIDHFLRPLGAPQERMICGYYYLNKYGFSFFRNLTHLPYTFDGTHKVILV